jgi:hypothetical protein
MIFFLVVQKKEIEIQTMGWYLHFLYQFVIRHIF